MKPIRPFLLAALLSASLQAQEAAPAPQELMQRLFDPKANEEQLMEAVKKAGMAGIPRQQLIEAKLVWGLRNQDSAWLTKILPELEVLAANFDRSQSAGLKSADEIRSFIAYTKALQAQDKNDEAGFKSQILEAIWLNPGQAQIFTQIIEKKRMEAKMANLKVDLALVITTHDGEATTLGDQLSDKKALLVDFWASWCGPCMQLMPELKKKAAELSKHGIVVAGMNKDDKDAQAVTAKIHDEQSIEFPWLIEPAERPFTKLLEIESIPRMVLIAPNGQVLFNGHPQDPALWVALQKVNPDIKAP
ncbi:thioredoxin [Prosthecobacter fusiformis]|uniref:Thioredoxin n=1 Tax=Prosthecobacter fusiformis TaxID=48464 RepID=A0A4V3FG15_9BACT|nr:TlpA disulfide reductase family protein [Prosthecobacter fusiformis]TDU72913.1 thioredoxin [Prosthecobacter fusiformis]